MEENKDKCEWEEFWTVHLLLMNLLFKQKFTTLYLC